VTRTSSLAVGLVLAIASAGCSRNGILDLAMSSAVHVPPPVRRVGPYVLLGGDLHCHVEPPDPPSHVSRELPETVRLATEEGLDFVVLTPHVPGRFFLDPEMREWVRGTQTVLRAKLEALPTDILFVHGMEYTDARFGHVGLAFANVEEVLDDLSLDELTAHPELFFVRWRARGGIMTLNHPTDVPIPGAPLRALRADRSWRGFGRDDAAQPPAVFPEIAWLSAHADALETFNLSLSHLRDRYFFGDPDWTLREGTHLLEREARRQERRISPVGGSDSHGSWLRPTTWVLATERSRSALRDAIVAGRTCVRGPEACSLEVRGADGAFHVSGASIATPPPPSRPTVQARARGGPVLYWINGVRAAAGADGETVEVALPHPGHCALLRASVGESWSAPVYVDCPWASLRLAP
jgi:hypothetical protein